MQSCQDVILSLTLTLTLPITLACGEASMEGEWDATDPAATSVESIGESACSTAQPNAHLDINAEEDLVTSPTIYSNAGCTKAYVVQALDAYASNPAEGSYFFAGWADMWERNRTQCVNGKLTVQLMSRPASGGSFRTDGVFERALHWDEERAECQYPTFGIYYEEGIWNQYYAINTPSAAWGESGFPLPDSLSGRMIKVAASARTPRGTTQPLRFFSGHP
jgi:hypothetical protein